MSSAHEINFDGLVGPTYTYSGLSWGNEASFQNKQSLSNPLEAFLQGLEKMKLLMDLGLKQAIIPPQERPDIATLKKLGFNGTIDSILGDVIHYAPWLLPYTSSASSMWTANAATITPSIDSVFKKVQITPANLHSKFHRSLEAQAVKKYFKTVFSNTIHFDVHDPLPSHDLFGDEGAANHIRFAKNHKNPGVHLFAYGNSRITDDELVPEKYPARQSKQASEAIIQLHKIYPKQVILAQQNPEAIDAGVFHNDVISTGNLNLFLCHQEAFTETDKVLAELKSKLSEYADADLIAIKVTNDIVTFNEAVKSYLFNSQIVTLPDGKMTFIAPSECQENSKIAAFLHDLAASSDNPINDIIYLNLKQSMQNGGGPACLRLRAVLNDIEFDHMQKGVLLTEALYTQLVEWGHKYYRDQLHPRDLADPKLYLQNKEALDTLTKLLGIGNIYSFQK